MRFVIYYLFSPLAVSCPRSLSFSLIDYDITFVWGLYSFFFLYHCYYPRTMLPKEMLIPYWTQYEVALCYNLEYISFSHPSLGASLKGRGQQPGQPARYQVCFRQMANGSDAIQVNLDLSLSEAKAAHAADSLCSNTHCGRAHMQSIPQFRSLFHLRPRPALPPRRVEQLREKARTGRRHG